MRDSARTRVLCCVVCSFLFFVVWEKGRWFVGTRREKEKKKKEATSWGIKTLQLSWEELDTVVKRYSGQQQKR